MIAERAADFIRGSNQLAQIKASFHFEQDWAIRKTANPALRLPVSLLVHAPVIHN
jgi:hypothetical protein